LPCRDVPRSAGVLRGRSKWREGPRGPPRSRALLRRTPAASVRRRRPGRVLRRSWVSTWSALSSRLESVVFRSSARYFTRAPRSVLLGERLVLVLDLMGPGEER